MLVDENLKKLNVEIPKAPDPVGAYLANKKTANLLYISGQISIDAWPSSMDNSFPNFPFVIFLLVSIDI